MNSRLNRIFGKYTLNDGSEHLLDLTSVAMHMSVKYAPLLSGDNVYIDTMLNYEHYCRSPKKVIDYVISECSHELIMSLAIETLTPPRDQELSGKLEVHPILTGEDDEQLD